jgi:hypothetical protein
MIYCVVPPELADQLFDKLTAHYADDPNVTVIVDRRSAERRKATDDPPKDHERTLRDRRRRRVVGEFPPLEGD